MKDNLRSVSTHAIRRTVLFQVAIRDLPQIRAALMAVLNLITRHDEFHPDHISRDMIHTISEAITYDQPAWKPWAKSLFEELTIMKSQSQLITRLDYIDAWETIIDTIDNALDVSYVQPTPSLN